MALTEEQEKRYLEASEVGKAMGLPAISREMWLTMNDGFEKIFDAIQKGETLEKASLAFKELHDKDNECEASENRMVQIVMSKKDADTFQKYIAKHNAEEMLMSDEVKLGDAVVDTVSEYKGIVTCIAEYDGYTSVEITRKGDEIS